MSIGNILLMLACLPSIILGCYVYKKDIVEKESSGLLVRLFVFGILSIALTLFLSSIVGIFIPIIDIEKTNSIFRVFIYSFFNVALVEEFSKWIFLKLATWNNKEFNHLYDAIVYAVFVALGFATLENILYVFTGGIFVAFIRALTSVPGHVFDGILSGYYYGLSKQASINGNKKTENKNMILSILIPTISHGFFDFCLFTGNIIFILCWIVFVIFLYIICFKKIKDMSKIMIGFYDSQEKEVQENDLIQVNDVLMTKHCTNCGNLLMGKYCSNCGKKAE